jgi:hypothetical protein
MATTARALYYLAAEDTEDAPSTAVDLGDGNYPKVEDLGARGYLVRLSGSLRRVIPHHRVILMEETDS